MKRRSRWPRISPTLDQCGAGSRVARGDGGGRKTVSPPAGADPRNGDAANGLGLLLAKQDRTDEARKLFELAISVRRDDASAINNLGVLYMNTGQPNDAIAAFRYGIQVAPDATIYT